MSFSMSSILEKMGNRDKDYRYMAASDLFTELEKETFRVDAATEQRLATALLALLKDNSNNIQELSVKCLGPFSRKAKDTVVIDVMEQLCESMVNEKTDELRDISCMALKAIVNACPPESPTLTSYIQKKLVARLLPCIQTHTLPEVKGFCVDVLNDIVTKFGRAVASEAVLGAVLPQLRSSASIPRKRATACLSLLAAVLPDALFAQLVEKLVAQLGEAGAKADHVRAAVQCVTAVANAAGARLGRYLKTLAPAVSKCCENPKFDQDDELREHCFLAFEAIALRCPKECAPYVEDILALALKYIKYDPNYAADEDDEDDGAESEEMETDEAAGGEDDEDEADASDDDDMSWKVRRTAAKCISAVIATRVDLLEEMYSRVAPVLVSRFREREENVKLDVFRTFTDLLRQSGSYAERLLSADAAKRVAAAATALVPRVVAGLTRQLREKSLKTRAGVFAVLVELVNALPGSLVAHIPDVVPGVVASVADKASNSNLKLEALTFLRLLLSTHPPSAFHKHAAEIATAVVRSISDPYFRISAEALRVSSELAGALQDAGARAQAEALLAATVEQLKRADADQDVKEAALNCVGSLMSVAREMLSPQEASQSVALIVDRLRNETTRLVAARVIAKVTVSSKDDVAPVVADAGSELATLLRKSNRPLRLAAIAALSALFEHAGASAPATLFSQVVVELSSLISDSDLQLAYLSLQLACQIYRGPGVSSVAGPLVEKLLPSALELTKSSLLQGTALTALQSLFSELAAAPLKSLSYEALVEQLLRKASEAPKTALPVIAQCVAAATAAAKPAQREASVNRFIKDVNKGKDDVAKVVALLCLSETGRRASLAGHSEALLAALGAALDSGSEDVRQAASLALGGVTVGCMEKFLGFVLEQISSKPARQYLLLHSLRVIITDGAAGASLLRPYLSPVLKLLFSHCEDEDEGTRGVVSECLGRLALLCPQEVEPEIHARLGAKSAHSRSTAVGALRYAVIDADHPVDAAIGAHVQDYLALLSDADLNVRKSTLLALNFVAHHKAKLVRGVLGQCMPLIYQETRINPALIREVDLGPFKHKVDDGLETRKSAFECLYTLIDVALDKIEMVPFLQHVSQGLSDHYDIKLLSHLTVARLANAAGPLIFEGLDLLVEPLRDVITTKAKDQAVKQEVERNDELVRSALRVVAAIARVPGADGVIKFRDFVRQVVMSPEYADKYKEVSKEADAPTADFDAGMADHMDTSS
eukprot:m51a1_g8691 putative cullin-associated nedd8-dissociated protein 1 (1234) ;mRNA; f:36761-41414